MVTVERALDTHMGSNFLYARDGRGTWWVKCTDGYYWIPLDPAERKKIFEDQYINAVTISYLIKIQGTVFYSQPEHKPAT